MNVTEKEASAVYRAYLTYRWWIKGGGEERGKRLEVPTNHVVGREIAFLYNLKTLLEIKLMEEIERCLLCQKTC